MSNISAKLPFLNIISSSLEIKFFFFSLSFSFNILLIITLYLLIFIPSSSLEKTRWVLLAPLNSFGTPIEANKAKILFFSSFYTQSSGFLLFAHRRRWRVPRRYHRHPLLRSLLLSKSSKRFSRRRDQAAISPRGARSRWKKKASRERSPRFLLKQRQRKRATWIRKTKTRTGTETAFFSPLRLLSSPR